MNQQTAQEYIRVPHRLTARWREPAGIYVNRLFLSMRDKKQLLAIKCPKCGAVWFPPEPVCGKCKVRIEDKEDNWVKLGNRGTLLAAYHVTGAREVDPSTGWHPDGQVFNPIGFIRPDGGNEWTLLAHVMEEPDTTNLKPGTRVEPVWKPRSQRTGTMQDIKFWRIVEE
ncbi:MAG: zinc ribbon domain-containing protein [Chloroflexota bacterium]